jgi:hypothetical protein
MTVADLLTKLETQRLDALVLVDRYSDYATPESLKFGYARPINGGEWYLKVTEADRRPDDVPILYIGWAPR